ncbi:MAG: TAXI family TRAP transporter solute-binding subunit [Aquisalimonadaceae bacterium]
MSKKLRSLALAVAAVVGMSAASTASAQILVLGGNPPGSLWYAQAQAIAATVNKHSDMRVDVLPQGGSAFFPMFGTDEVDMGLVNPIEALFATKAEWPFEGVNNDKGYEMRTIMLGSPIRLSIVTRKDSDIKEIADLRGKRVVANYGAFSGATLTARSVLANGDMTPDDVEVVNVSSYPEGVRAVMEGRADAAVGSIGSGILQELEASHGANLLEIDPSDEAMARVREVAPAFVPMLVKQGPPGVNKDQQALSYSTTVVSRPNLDAERVKKFIDAVWDHHEELPGIHRSLVTWTPDRFASENAVIPYHPAAIEYYKEKGVWTDAAEKNNAALMAQ